MDRRSLVYLGVSAGNSVGYGSLKSAERTTSLQGCPHGLLPLTVSTNAAVSIGHAPLRFSSRSLGTPSRSRIHSGYRSQLGMSFVGLFPIGVVVHFRHDQPRSVFLALKNPKRVVVPDLDFSAPNELLALDL